MPQDKRYTDPGSSRGTEASHVLVWEGTYGVDGNYPCADSDNDPLDVRIIELAHNDLLVQVQRELDGVWDTAVDDEIVLFALHEALVAHRNPTF